MFATALVYEENRIAPDAQSNLLWKVMKGVALAFSLAVAATSPKHSSKLAWIIMLLAF